ncbi:hypothetical protein N7540_006438 [Penicillium herquei]|nr:hypothetical protein N7540_006438 [Penicillium herquei]
MYAASEPPLSSNPLTRYDDCPEVCAETRHAHSILSSQFARSEATGVASDTSKSFSETNWADCPEVSMKPARVIKLKVEMLPEQG